MNAIKFGHIAEEICMKSWKFEESTEVEVSYDQQKSFG